ncbi:hypothetical protein BJV40_005376 [Clostridium beijerinckii]|nr:hypothetical protein [Clostridium beijerinckii]
MNNIKFRTMGQSIESGNIVVSQEYENFAESTKF